MIVGRALSSATSLSSFEYTDTVGNLHPVTTEQDPPIRRITEYILDPSKLTNLPPSQRTVDGGADGGAARVHVRCTRSGAAGERTRARGCGPGGARLNGVPEPPLRRELRRLRVRGRAAARDGIWRDEGHREGGGGCRCSRSTARVFSWAEAGRVACVMLSRARMSPTRKLRTS